MSYEGRKDKRISSVKAFVEEITELRKAYPADYGEQWFFRGQKNVAWDVRPSIFRDDNLACEHIMIAQAQRQNPVEFRECVTNFEILTKLQHYGLGTRLLDVTLNPLVALFFATEPSSEFVKNSNGQYTQKEHDGSVYCSFVNGYPLQDLRIRIAVSIPFVEFGKSMSLEIFCNNLKENNVITEDERKSLADDEYASMIQLLQSNSFIVATNSNIRLIQQRGAFLLSPSINIKPISEVKSSSISKAKMNLAKEFSGRFIIPSKDKEGIRQELDFFNVNEATLFPELEHQMLYIQHQARPPIGTVEECVQYVRTTDTKNKIQYDKVLPDVHAIVHLSLPNVGEDVRTELSKTIIAETQMLDWYKKDSVISSIRREIAKGLSETLSAVDTKSKVNEIMDRLLE